MGEVIATALEMQNNFGGYLDFIKGEKIIIWTQNGQEIGGFIPQKQTTEYLSNTLLGISNGNCDYREAKDEWMHEKIYKN